MPAESFFDDGCAAREAVVGLCCDGVSTVGKAAVNPNSRLHRARITPMLHECSAGAVLMFGKRLAQHWCSIVVPKPRHVPVGLPTDLIERADRLVETPGSGYTSRAEVVKDALRRFLEEQEALIREQQRFRREQFFE